MDENSTMPASQPKNNTMMLVIGGIVLAAILGYVVISSAAKKDESTANGDETTAKDETMKTDESNNDSANMDNMDANATPTMSDDSTMEGMAGTGPTDAMPSPTMTDTMDDSSVKTFDMSAGSFYYKPNVMNVKVGDKVRINLKADDMMHNLNIDELGVKSDTVKAGESTTVEFTATKAGTFEFYCGIGQHRANGQVGTLTVTE